MSRTACLVVIAILCVAPSAARGQCDLPGEIDRATLLIERAQEVTARSSVLEARELVRAAMARRDEAIQLGRDGRRDMACRLARVAQGFAIKAVEIARSGLRGLEELERMLDRTDESLRDAEEVVRESGSEDAVRLLHLARKQENEAWSAFRGRRPRIAMKLTLMARESGARAVRMAEGRPAEDAERVSLELRQTDRLLEEAKGVLGESNDGDLDRARRIQGIAERQLGRGHPALALGLTLEARGAVRRALADADSGPEAEDVEGMIATTAELVRNLEESATASENLSARDRLARAEALLDAARKALAAKDLRGAFTDARAASSLALEASEMLDGGNED